MGSQAGDKCEKNGSRQEVPPLDLDVDSFDVNIAILSALLWFIHKLIIGDQQGGIS